MVSPPLSTSCVACHSNTGFPACRQFTAGSAYSFALANSVAGNPGASLFLRKNNGGCAGGCLSCTGATIAGHSGGAPWSPGGVDPSGEGAVTNWINNGRLPEPESNPLASLSAAAFELIRRPWSAQESRPYRLPSRQR
jgi:hypothetical protein